MTEEETEIVKLTSVTLTREKQDKIDVEFERYVSATNFVIKTILRDHIPSGKKVLEKVKEEFVTRFDKREQYLRDVVKTAWSEIQRHRRMAKTVRSMRAKAPVFRDGRMIFSKPIIKIQEQVLTLETAERERVPIPYDKPSRNRAAVQLRALAGGSREYERVRLTWNKEGYMNIDIRIKGEPSVGHVTP
ncbi:MAG: hypothetical protein ACE5H4_13610 [Candidatus Thorarchaeota archaeon]